MKSIKTAELKDALSATLRAVERGARVLVTDRERPVAMLVPVDDEHGVTIVPASRPFSSVRRTKHPRIATDGGVLSLLAIDRGER